MPTATEILCLYCDKPLSMTKRGWVHTETGELYATFVGPDGKRRDDHCAIPRRS